MTDADTALKLLRSPFPDHQISKLPKATKNQTEALKADRRLGIRCQLCGQWHHKETIHLDYVGHAALTDRLLDADPMWNWEPMALTPEGQPAYDRSGGLWIKLTVAGMSRIGYGNAEGKSGGDAIKEIIGDALRNAAMRFGAALDLWHKGDLHLPDAESSGEGSNEPPVQENQASESEKQASKPISAAAQKRQLAEIDADLLDAHSEADVKRCANIWKSIAVRDGWSRDYQLIAKEKFDKRRAEVIAARSGEDDDYFPGDTPNNDIRNHPMNAG